MAKIAATAFFRDKFVSFSDANLSIASAPVLYGLSVYTVFPVFKAAPDKRLNIFRIKDHFERLVNSSKIMEFTDLLNDWDLKRFTDTMCELVEKNKIQTDCLVRVAVYVDDNLKGTRMLGLKHQLSAFVYTDDPLLPSDGAKVCVSSWLRTPDNSIPSRAKINGSYVNSALMKHEAVLNGYDDAIALDSSGHITEGTVANVFMVRDNKLITPDSSTDLLEGITRDSIIKIAKELGIRTEVRAIDRSEIYLADEVFFSGSSVKLTFISEVDHRKIGTGKMGYTTKLLQDLYKSIARSQSNKFQEWVTPLGQTA
jgi:branched-chain amino acid aminotransferase